MGHDRLCNIEVATTDHTDKRMVERAGPRVSSYVLGQENAQQLIDLVQHWWLKHHE